MKQLRKKNQKFERSAKLTKIFALGVIFLTFFGLIGNSVLPLIPSSGLRLTTPRLTPQSADDNSAPVVTLDQSEQQTYAGTYSFTQDQDGQVPSEGTIVASGNGAVTVAGNVAGHDKVLKITSSGSTAMWQDWWSTTQTSGTIEFWVYVTSGSYGVETTLWSPSACVFSAFWMSDTVHVSCDGNWYGTGISLVSNAWHYGRIVFDCNNNLVYLYVDGAQAGGPWTCSGKSEVSRFDTGTWGATNTAYIDAIGYSFDPSYKIGMNLQPGNLALNYPAALSFTDGTIGQAPEVTASVGSGSSITVQDALAGHAKVLKVASSGAISRWIDWWPAYQTSGTVEFWVYVESGSYGVDTSLSSPSAGAFDAFWMPTTVHVFCDGNWYGTGISLAPDMWHHGRIVFDCGANQVYLYVDGVQAGGSWTCSGQATVSRFDFGTWGATNTAYIDAIDYSWSPNYVAGRDFLPEIFTPTSNLYYPTFSFSQYNDGQVPGGTIIANPPSNTVTVKDEVAGHSNVLKITSTGSTAMWQDWWTSHKTFGAIEFWVYVTSGSYGVETTLWSPSACVFSAFWMSDTVHVFCDGNWYGTGISLAPDTWHHGRIEFSCGANQVFLYVDGVQAGGPWTCSGQSEVSRFDTGTWGCTMTAYLDDIAYSWDQNGQMPTYTFTDNTPICAPSVSVSTSGSSTITVENSLAGHSQVLKVASAGAISRWIDWWPASRTSGTVEFWVYVASGSYGVDTALSSPTAGAFDAFWMPNTVHVFCDGNWYGTGTSLAPDAWHYGRIVFNCANNLVTLYVDGVQAGGPWTCSGQQSGISRFDFGTWGCTLTAYADDIDYSWAPQGNSQDSCAYFVSTGPALNERYLSWTISDSNVGSSPTYSLFLDNQPVQGMQNVNWQSGSRVQVDLSPYSATLASGLHQFHLEVHDQWAGGSGDLVTNSYAYIDIDAPPVATPLPTSNYFSTANIAWSLTDPYLIAAGASWELFRDGYSIGSGTFSYSGQIVSVPQQYHEMGAHTYAICVTDGYVSATSSTPVDLITANWECDAFDNMKWYGPEITIPTDASKNNLAISTLITANYLGNQYGEVEKPQFAQPSFMINTQAWVNPSTSPQSYVRKITISISATGPDNPLDATSFATGSGSYTSSPIGDEDPTTKYISDITWDFLKAEIPYGIGDMLHDTISIGQSGYSFNGPSIQGNKASWSLDTGTEKPLTALSFGLNFNAGIDPGNHGYHGDGTYTFTVIVDVTRQTGSSTDDTSESLSFTVYNPDVSHAKAGNFDENTAIVGITGSANPLTLANFPNTQKVSVTSWGNVVQHVHVISSIEGNFNQNDVLIMPGTTKSLFFVPDLASNPSATTFAATSYTHFPYDPDNLGPLYYHAPECSANSPWSTEDLSTWSVTPSSGEITNLGNGQADIYTGDDWGVSTLWRTIPSGNFFACVQVNQPSSMQWDHQAGFYVSDTSNYNAALWGFSKDWLGGYHLWLNELIGGYLQLFPVISLDNPSSSIEWIGIQLVGSTWSFLYYDGAWEVAGSIPQGGSFQSNVTLGFTPTQFGIFSRQWLLPFSWTAQFRGYSIWT